MILQRSFLQETNDAVLHANRMGHFIDLFDVATRTDFANQVRYKGMGMNWAGKKLSQEHRDNLSKPRPRH